MKMVKLIDDAVNYRNYEGDDHDCFWYFTLYNMAGFKEKGEKTKYCSFSILAFSQISSPFLPLRALNACCFSFPCYSFTFAFLLI